MTVTAPITADQALNVAEGQEGVREDPPGSNHVLYAEWYGLDRNPWCAMFVSWVLHTAGWVGFAITTSKGYASVYAGVTWFKQHDAWAGPDVVPQPGWIVFYGFGEGHTGLVKSARSVSDITTIEGNTDDAGGGSGGKVMEKHRSATSSSDHILGYGLITYLPARPALQEDDMACIYSLNEKLTYPGLGDLAPGYAVYVVGNVREHVDSPATQNQRVHDGCPARGVSALEMAAILDMTVDKIQRLIKT